MNQPNLKLTAIATWPFGLKAVKVGGEILLSGGNSLDAVERGLNAVECDVDVNSVGYGGLPNEDSVVELEAAIMSGASHKAGSVAGLQNIKCPISVARKVMERTRHVMLVGEGALKFALRQGFQAENLLTEESRQKWLEWKERSDNLPRFPHDTIGMIVLDGKGDLSVGCSTSGMAYKMAGRVGDSSQIGSGLYVDNEIGGAAATGMGEEILKFCPSFLVVELMRNGFSPQAACEIAIQRIIKKNPEDRDIMVGLIALSKKGDYGAASTHAIFSYSLWTPETSFVKEAKT